MATEDKLDGTEKKEGPLDNFSGKDAEEVDNIKSSRDLPHRDNDTHEIDRRNAIYTNILWNYYDYITHNSKTQLNLKSMIVKVFVGLLIFTVIAIFVIVGMAIYLNPTSIASIIAIISSLITLVSALIIIPSKITDYVFNVNETIQVGDIIKNIQEYDKAVRDDLYKTGKLYNRRNLK